MSEAKACKCDHCGTVERLVAPQTHPIGWILVFGMPIANRLDFCCPGHLVAWATNTGFVHIPDELRRSYADGKPA